MTPANESPEGGQLLPEIFGGRLELPDGGHADLALSEDGAEQVAPEAPVAEMSLLDMLVPSPEERE